MKYRGKRSFLRNFLFCHLNSSPSVQDRDAKVRSEELLAPAPFFFYKESALKNENISLWIHIRTSIIGPFCAWKPTIHWMPELVKNSATTEVGDEG